MYLLEFCRKLISFTGGIENLQVVDNRDGTRSLLNRSNKKLLVTFRAENQDYDKEVLFHLGFLILKQTRVSLSLEISKNNKWCRLKVTIRVIPVSPNVSTSIFVFLVTRIWKLITFSGSWKGLWTTRTKGRTKFWYSAKENVNLREWETTSFQLWVIHGYWLSLTP